jgi:hypothetical protein
MLAFGIPPVIRRDVALELRPGLNLTPDTLGALAPWRLAFSQGFFTVVRRGVPLAAWLLDFLMPV